MRCALVIAMRAMLTCLGLTLGFKHEAAHTVKSKERTDGSAKNHCITACTLRQGLACIVWEIGLGWLLHLGWKPIRTLNSKPILALNGRLAKNSRTHTRRTRPAKGFRIEPCTPKPLRPKTP